MFQHLQRSEQSNDGTVAITVFDGFDGNNDDHKGVAFVLVEKLGRFGDLIGATNNSHSLASLRTYKQMLDRYQPMVTGDVDAGVFRALTSAEIHAVLNG
jgi:hypothetical protein